MAGPGKLFPEPASSTPLISRTDTRRSLMKTASLHFPTPVSDVRRNGIFGCSGPASRIAINDGLRDDTGLGAKDFSGASELDLVHPDTEIARHNRIAAFGTHQADGARISSPNSAFFCCELHRPSSFHLEYPETIGCNGPLSQSDGSADSRCWKRPREKIFVSTSHFAFPGWACSISKGEAWEWQPIPATRASAS